MVVEFSWVYGVHVACDCLHVQDSDTLNTDKSAHFRFNEEVNTCAFHLSRAPQFQSGGVDGYGVEPPKQQDICRPIVHYTT